MGTSFTVPCIVMINVCLIANVVLFMLVSGDEKFTEDFDVTWGGENRAKILNNGEFLTLSLDEESGSGFQSKNKYLYGNMNMQLKLVPGESAGTVTAYYLWSNESKWDEIDFGFFGNRSGEPYILHTNVVTEGEGNREQQFYLWFDPTVEFHTYSILWNPQRILFAVDDAPIRIFKNLKSEQDIPYPSKQAMRIYGGVMSAEDLAEPDWTQAPFTTTFANFDATESCPLISGEKSSCGGDGDGSSGEWLSEDIDSAMEERVRWVQNNFMIYNYCSDVDRFPHGLPLECNIMD